jgi:acetyl esterase
VADAAPLHPQVRALLEAPGEAEPEDLAGRRAAYADVARRLGGPPAPMAEVRDVTIPSAAGGIPGRAYRPAAAEARGAAGVCWLHGGGWILGDLEGIDRVCRALAGAAGAVVLSVDYRLAPEHPHPAAVHDADAAVAWLRGGGGRALGVDAERVVVGGDSAGGNLAAVAALHARDRVRAQLLAYPATDALAGGGSWRRFADDATLPAGAMRDMWDAYLAGGDPAAPDASPLRAALAGAPPALVAVAGHDVLRDEGRAYAAALTAAGVEAELLEFADMAHGFLRWGGVVDRARELVAEMGRFVRRHAGDVAG